MNKPKKIVLVGSPNSGKSSLFNQLTGLRQKTANFPGVTVEKHTGLVPLGHGQFATLVDLPGIYSLYPRRMDEFITFDVLMNPENEDYPDLIILILDANNLKRGLLLCSQIIDLKIPTVVALNMMDVARSSGLVINASLLMQELGVKVIPINARQGKGLAELKRAIQTQVALPDTYFIDVRSLAPDVIGALRQVVPVRSDYGALHTACHYIHLFCLQADQKKMVREVLERHQFSAAKIQAQDVVQRYERIQSLLQRAVTHDPSRPTALDRARQLDHILLHPTWGYLILIAIFYLVFQAMFSWAEYPMQAIDWLVAQLKGWLHVQLPKNMWSDLLVEGVLSGIGGIVIFIPQIMLLFGFITVLEETGYMTRVSFLMDRLMRQVGMSGNSTLPLVSGMACAVPAIMGTRNIPNVKDRLITMLVTPFMSCSARLPVYSLLIGFVVPDRTLWGFMNLKGLAMLGMYVLGWVVALAAAWVLKMWITTREQGVYVMELPIYRWPRWRNVVITMVNKSRVFVVDAGKIILSISIVLWFLASFGPGRELQRIEERYARQLVPGADSLRILEQLRSEKLEASYAGHIGKLLEPVIAPLGFDWRIGIALITSFAAREVFVATMATIYSTGSGADSSFDVLRERMRNERNMQGQMVYTAATGLSLMIFYAFALQCMSTVAVVRRETRSWKWPLLQLFFMTGFAYLASFVVYQLMA